MKKFLFYFLFLFGIATLLYGGYRASNSTRVKILLMKSTLEEIQEEPILAIYDPQHHSLEKPKPHFKHLKLILNNNKTWKVDNEILRRIPDTVPVVITIEMWDIRILKKIAEGSYDEKIKTFFTSFLEGRDNVFLRWNPEMDVPASRFPWEMNPTAYIEAFNHFADNIEQVSPNTQMMWAPAGHPGVLESYPGDELTDAASLTLNSTSENLIENYEQHPLPYQVQRKLHRLRFINKPIFIIGSNERDQEILDASLISDVEEYLKENDSVIYPSGIFKRPVIEKATNEEPILLGLFDPDENLVEESQISIEHLFIDFSGIIEGELQSKIKEVVSRDHDVILTVEPGMQNQVMANKQVLQDLTMGNYDKVLEELYKVLENVNKTIYLRFAHEMEIPITRYSWQSKDPVVYIKAFRYFMEFSQNNIPHIKRIWGPAGDRGSLEWYPGDDVVDYISIAIYGLPDKNITDPQRQETFHKILSRKLYRFRFLDKPFFITEFGVKGDEDFQTQWLTEATESIRNEPKIMGISYFNNSDVPKAWGNIEPPDWSISRSTFREFTEALYQE